MTRRTLFERADVRVDHYGSVVGVGVVALECGEFAPAAAGPGGGDDEQCAATGASAAVAVVVNGVGWDEAVVDGVAWDAAEKAE